MFKFYISVFWTRAASIDAPSKLPLTFKTSGTHGGSDSESFSFVGNDVCKNTTPRLISTLLAVDDGCRGYSTLPWISGLHYMIPVSLLCLVYTCRQKTIKYIECTFKSSGKKRFYITKTIYNRHLCKMLHIMLKMHFQCLPFPGWKSLKAI